MTDIYLHPHHVKELDLDALILRAIDLQAIYQDNTAELSRVRDTIRSVRTRSTYDFVTFKKAEATRLAEAALAGTAPGLTEMPDVLGSPSESQIQLTLSGLDAKVRELEQKLMHIRGAHQVTISTIADHHSKIAAAEFVQARDAFVRSTAALVSLDRALQRVGLPATDSVYLPTSLELPLVASERTTASGWSKLLTHFMEPHLRSMPENYRAQLSQLGVTLKLEG